MLNRQPDRIQFLIIVTLVVMTTMLTCGRPVVEADLVDAVDCGLRVGICRQQYFASGRVEPAGFAQ